ncbi:MAG: hypothetical protein U1F34_09685 [Gammaproteobacteria bacterium]
MFKTSTFVLLLLSAIAAHAEQIGFQTITLDWPDGYQSTVGDDKIHMAGPNGEEVTIVQFSLDEGTSDEEARAKTDTLRQYAETEMPKTAHEQGSTIVRDLKKTDFDDRHTLYSMISQHMDGDAQKYLIEYFLVGVKGGAYFSIVGNGDATAGIATFDPVFAGVQWKE